MKAIAGKTLLTAEYILPQQSSNVLRQRMNISPQRTKNIFFQYANNVFALQTSISPQLANKYYAQRGNVSTQRTNNVLPQSAICLNGLQIIFCLNGLQMIFCLNRRMFCLRASTSFVNASFLLRSSNYFISFRFSSFNSTSNILILSSKPDNNTIICCSFLHTL